MMRDWHAAIMRDLAIPDPAYVGRFRGEPGVEHIRVGVLGVEATPPGQVAAELADFERRLRRVIVQLDSEIPAGSDLTVDNLRAVIEVCAWAHGEWVRIHPFVNGNGRSGRLWIAYIAMRYGLPIFVRMRPRRDDDYGAAAARAMRGDWQALVPFLRRQLAATLRAAN